MALALRHEYDTQLQIETVPANEKTAKNGVVFVAIAFCLLEII